MTRKQFYVPSWALYIAGPLAFSVLYKCYLCVVKLDYYTLNFYNSKVFYLFFRNLVHMHTWMHIVT